MNISDSKHAALVAFTGHDGHTDDLEQEFLAAQGATSEHVNDMWYEVFFLNGSLSPNWNDAAQQFLINLGAPYENINQNWFWFWDNGATIGPVVTIQLNSGGFCDYTDPDASCTALATYEANDFGFTNPADTWLWTITEGGGWRWDIADTALAYDETGLDNNPDTATTVTDTSATDYSIVRQGISTNIGATTITARLYVKKDSDQTRFPQFRLTSDIGESVEVRLDTLTGAFDLRFPSGVYDALVVDGGDWWEVYLQLNIAASPNNMATIIVYAAASTTFAGAEEAAAVGSVIIGNVEVYEGKVIADVNGTSFIYTDDVPVTDGALTNLCLWSHEITHSGAHIVGDNYAKTVDVSTGSAAVDVPFELKVTATDSASTDTADRTSSLNQDHDNITEAPGYVGPQINDRDYVIGVEITPVDTFNLFTGDYLTFSLENIWPTGLVIDPGPIDLSATAGQVTGTPTSGETQLSGTVSTGSGTPLINGFGTFFTTELDVGDKIRILATTLTVESITDDTNLVVTENVGASVSSQPYYLQAEGTYNDLQIRVTNSQGIAESTAFTINLASGADAPIFDNGPVPDQNWPIDQAIAQFPIGQFFLTGTFPRTYTIESGALPSGLTMNTAGQVNGTPTVDAEVGSVVIRCTNSAGFALTNEWSWLTWEAISQISNIPDQTAEVDGPFTHDYSQYFTGTVSGYVINAASWPPDTVFDTATGIATFTPTAEFSHTGAVVVAESDYTPSFIISNNFDWTVAGIVFVYITDRTFTVGTPIATSAFDFLESGHVTLWEFGGPWPDWIDIDPNTGLISGTPTEEHDYQGLYLLASNSIEIGVESNVFDAFATASVLPDFWGVTPDIDTGELMGVRVGVGGLTEANVSSRYYPDFEGIWQKFPSGMPGYVGARCELAGGVGTDVVSVWANNAPLGTPITDYWLVGQRQIQNVAFWSNDGTNAVWAKTGMTAAKDQVGMRGEANGATLLTATAGNATIIQTITVASGDYVTRFFLKRNSGAGVVEICIDGTTWTPVTLTADYQEFLVEQAALANPQIGIRIVTSGDSVVMGNGEGMAGTVASTRRSSALFTEGATVVVDASNLSFDIANHADTGCYYCEYMPASVAGSGVIRLGAADAPILQHTSAQYRVLSSGDALGAASYGSAADVATKCGVSFSIAEGLKLLNVEGALSLEVAFTGFNGTTPSIVPLGGKFGNTPAYTVFMRDIRRYNAEYDEAKTLISDLVGA